VIFVISTDEGIQWEGKLEFSIFDEYEARKRGLLDNQGAFFNALKNGTLPVKRKVKSQNTVTNFARRQIVSVLTNSVSSIIPPSKMELGTGSGTPSASDTNLWSPSAPTMKQCSSIQAYLTYYAQFICTWLSTDSIQGSWTEVGLFDSNNNLWAHSAITLGVSIATGDALAAQWSVQIISS
jgi:hypothetical protein